MTDGPGHHLKIADELLAETQSCLANPEPDRQNALMLLSMASCHAAIANTLAMVDIAEDVKSFIRARSR